MRDQINFSRGEQFSQFLNGLNELEGARKIAHGVFIEMHPMWRRLIDMQRAWDAGFDWDFFSPWREKWVEIAPSWNGPYDLSQVPDLWQHILSRHQKEGQFLVKIYVLPTTPGTRPFRKTLEDYAQKQPFFTVVIDEPLPMMATAVEGAADMSATMSGTLGGFLKDQNGETWGITCGHVAQAAGISVVLENVGGGRDPLAGTVRYSNFTDLKRIGAQDLCKDPGDGTAIGVDLALLEIDGKYTPQDTVNGIAGRIDAIYDKSDLGSGSIVKVRGAITGPHDYILQGYGVSQKVGLKGTSDYFCFSDVFDFAQDTDSRLQRALALLPVQGDSGAWVLHEKDHACALAGMLVAVRAGRGISVFAESIKAWADTNWGKQLAPL